MGGQQTYEYADQLLALQELRALGILTESEYATDARIETEDTTQEQLFEDALATGRDSPA